MPVCVGFQLLNSRSTQASLISTLRTQQAYLTMLAPPAAFQPILFTNECRACERNPLVRWRNALELDADGKPRLISDAEEGTDCRMGECISTRTNQSGLGGGGASIVPSTPGHATQREVN
ncbi:hypothetical protein AOLI_G00025340 [Acnodon oligacanthus]